MSSRGRVALACAALALTACSDDGGTTGPGAGGSGGAEPAPSAASHVLGDPQLGDPELSSAQRITFASGGVLLVADGLASQVVAIETGDVDPATRSQHVFERVDDLGKRVAEALDVESAGNVWIQDLALNPLSFRVYLAVTRWDTGEAAILWVDAKGRVHPLSVEQVLYAATSYSLPSSGATSYEVGWIEGYLVASLMGSEPRLCAATTPIDHGSSGALSKPRFYHPAWGSWQNDLAADGLLLLDHQGTPWLVAAFSDGPLVRFGVEIVAAGQPLSVGTTFANFGMGRMVRDLADHPLLGDDGVLMIIEDFWNDVMPRGYRLARSMLMQEGALNEEAPLLLDYLGTPLSPLMERVEDLDGAERIAPVPGRAQVVVLRQNALEWLELAE